jgi:hypothetical protein
VQPGNATTLSLSSAIAEVLRAVAQQFCVDWGHHYLFAWMDIKSFCCFGVSCFFHHHAVAESGHEISIAFSYSELPGFWSPMHILLCFMVGSQMYAIVDPTSYLTSEVLWAFAFCGWF